MPITSFTVGFQLLYQLTAWQRDVSHDKLRGKTNMEERTTSVFQTEVCAILHLNAQWFLAAKALSFRVDFNMCWSPRAYAPLTCHASKLQSQEPSKNRAGAGQVIARAPTRMCLPLQALSLTYCGLSFHHA